MESLPNGVIVPKRNERISESGVDEMRVLGASVDSKLAELMWNRPLLSGATHLDDLSVSGSYSRQGSFFRSIGYPEDGSGLVNIIHTQSTPTGYASQIAGVYDFAKDEQRIYLRHKELGVWSEWTSTGGVGSGYGFTGVEATGEWTTLVDEISLLTGLGKHREAEYFEVGRSVQGRVIPGIRIGFATNEDGSPRATVLVTGGVHADERGTREGALRLIRELIQASTIDRYRISIIVVPNVNPDGFEAWTRANANGVNLNRDFIDATQPETQAVRALVEANNIIAALDLHGGGSGLRVNFVEPDPTRHSITDAVMERSTRMFDAVWEHVLDHGEVPFRYPYTDGSDGEGLVGTFHSGIAADYGVPSLLLELPFIAMEDRDDRLLPPRVWMAATAAMFAHGAINTVYREWQEFQAAKNGTSYTIPERHQTDLEVARDTAEEVTGLAARLAALEQDTGWRDVSADLRSGATGTLHVRREGLTVWWRVMNLVVGEGHAFYWPPAGMAAPSDPLVYPPQSAANDYPFYLDSVGRICRERTAPALAGGRWWGGSYVLPSGAPPVTTLPGTPA